MSVGTKIGVAFALGLVLLAAVGGSAYVSMQHLLEANRWVVHTHEVQKKLDDVLAAHLDAETGQRGFIITGDDRYLEPYNAGIRRIQQDIDTLVSLTGDNASQQESLRQVRKLSDVKLAELRETIRLRRESGLKGALQVLLTDRGKKIMDDLRGVVVQMKAREQTLLDARTATAEAGARRAIWTIAAWMPLALVVLAVAAVALMRTVRFGGPSAPTTTLGKAWAGIAIRYASAVIIVAVAVMLRMRLIDAFGPLPLFIVLYPAVLLAASLGGGGPGIVATALSAAAADYFFIPPYGQFSIEAPNDVLALGIFTSSSLFLSVLAERLRRTRWAEAFSFAQQERAEELSRQNEELTGQSEELSQQAEELSQQSEELSRQNEELQTQSEEILALNDELGHREDLLQVLLDAARLAGSERAAMQEVCSASLRMFGEAATAVIVYEEQGEKLRICASAGLGELDAASESLPTERSFAELVIQQNRTASLNDVALRPDLSILEIAGLGPFQAELCAPMRRAGRAFGAVAVYGSKRQEWTAEQFRLTEWLAGQCTQTLENLRMRQELARVASFPALNPNPIVEADPDGRVSYANPMAQRLFPDIEQRGAEHPWLADWPAVAEACRTGASLSGREVVVDDRLYHQAIHFIPQTGRIRTYGLDITETKRAEQEREVAIEFLRLVNESVGTRDLVQAATTFFKQQSGCEAVGVRMKEGDDYPYCEPRGFPAEFVLVENKLCSRDSAGNVIRDSAGNPLIECICGNVIYGRFDPSKPFFTAHGSFWTNSTTELLASTSEADRQTHTRDRCNGQGYESVALLPLYIGDARLGLLQLNDRRKGMFTPAVIGLWERLAGYLAVALAKFRADDEVRQLNADLERRVADQTEEIRKANRTLEQRVAERTAALSESETRFRRLVAQVPIPLCLVSKEGALVYCNDRFVQTFGYTRDDVPTLQQWRRLAYPDEKYRRWVIATWEAAVHRAAEEKLDIQPLEYNVTCKDGSVRVVEISGITTEGNFLATFIDLTERKRVEDAAFKAKTAAEAANEMKSQFLANMSHELRTPMNAILGMIDVALPKAMDATVRDCLKTARESADLLLTLLDDLLDSAKIESGKLELEAAPFSLRRMLDQIARVLSVRASEKGLRFACPMADETPDALIGDRMRLQQVLLNLAGNAIKFTEHGDVRIDVRVVEGAAMDRRLEEGKQPVTSDFPYRVPSPPSLIPSATLEFAVRDTGIGIPSPDLERLFQPFAQADASMARRFGGTGLGLSICKRLVKLMGGHIGVESEPGKGSTFYFIVRLPLAKELPSDFEASVAVPAAACTPLRILLAEDNPANQKLATYVLQDRGHIVEIAGDGRQAISRIEKKHYDVVLMDVQMPGMDGLEATAAIRQREAEMGSGIGGQGSETNKPPETSDSPSSIPDLQSPIPSRHLPIIAMTAHAMKGDRERCLAAGMDGYLSKPIDAHEMIALVERLAAGSPSTEVGPVPPSPDRENRSGQPFAAIFDPALALRQCLGKQDLLARMIRFFFDDIDKLLPQVRVALQRGDLTEVGRLGHRLKGTVGHLAAEPAREAAMRVEHVGLPGSGQAEAEEAVRMLEQECQALTAAISKHQNASPPHRD
jgi:PAS domain S-box-containing protein